MPDLYQAVAAEVASITPDKVILRVMKTGGGFGRRASPDADIIVEAVATARALGWKAPVKVQWTREDDMRAGRYRPAFVHKLKAALDEKGELIALRDTVVGQSIAKGTLFEQGLVREGVDRLSVEGIQNQPYAVPNLRVDLTTTYSPVTVLWWRAVGSTHTAYALESFIDEIAHAAGKDTVEFRLAMLKDKPRHAAVLKLAAEKAGWSLPAPAERHRGIALAESFRSYVAQVAEISIDRAGRPKVHRVVCAVDCGGRRHWVRSRRNHEVAIDAKPGKGCRRQLRRLRRAQDRRDAKSGGLHRQVHCSTYRGWRARRAANRTCRGERLLQCNRQARSRPALLKVRK